ncbi:MAG: outer membrane protein assembly factor BamD [Deltaproteobacteria bacterium]|nr:outer membrane protein assembly factor BamD [Deltaproteobacteria bacterium]
MKTMTWRGLCVALVCVGCATAAMRKGDAPQDYYEAGMEDLKKELWVEAATEFATLKAKFPYSKFAALAELRLADIKHGSEKYLEAIDAYRLFIQYHPTHDEVPHATFMEAMSHFKEIPDDFFFLPPAHEKDQAEVEKAARAFKEYVERFPEGAKAEEAKQRLADCYMRLAQHDLYVARFYKRSNKWRGAAARYENLRTYMTGTSLEPAVLLELGETYVKLKDNEKVRAVYARLLEAHPQSAEAKEAAGVLATLKDPPAPASTPASGAVEK